MKVRIIELDGHSEAVLEALRRLLSADGAQVVEANVPRPASGSDSAPSTEGLRQESLPSPRASRGRQAGPRLCTVDGCDKPHCARGFCEMHWRRWRTHGDPNIVLPPGRKRGHVPSPPPDGPPVRQRQQRRATAGGVFLDVVTPLPEYGPPLLVTDYYCEHQEDGERWVMVPVGDDESAPVGHAVHTYKVPAVAKGETALGRCGCGSKQAFMDAVVAVAGL